MKLDSLDNVKPINNLVIVKPNPDNTSLKVGKGFILYLATQYDPLRYATTTGVVVKVPDKLDNFEISSNASLQYDTDLEVQVGDTVIFHYLTRDANVRDGRILTINDEEYFQIRYDRLFCAIRNDEIIMLNGTLIVEADREELESEFLITQHTNKKSQTRGVVRYAGSPLKGYRDFPDDGGDLDEVAVGDHIIFRSVDALPLQNDTQQLIDRGKTYYRMQRRDVLLKLEE